MLNKVFTADFYYYRFVFCFVWWRPYLDLNGFINDLIIFFWTFILLKKIVKTLIASWCTFWSWFPKEAPRYCILYSLINFQWNAPR